ncbi:MAG: hypothetical protein O2898_09690 [Proteobacteria bacterium]|nr:hypothetical protein [Pseudomonadota bacterium]
MGVPRKNTLEAKFKDLDNEIRASLQHYPKLLNDFPCDVLIAYLFSRIELAQNNAIYCGIVKIHKLNAKFARIAVANWHITRDGFRSNYGIVFDRNFPEDVTSRLSHAEKIRDAIVHGKAPKEGAMRQSVFDVLEYSVGLSKTVSEHGGFTPFGSLKGFKGRAKSHDLGTSRWILKGMGFNV